MTINRRRRAAAVALLAAATGGCEPEAPSPSAAVAFVNATFHTVSGREYPDGALLVEDGRIVACGPRDLARGAARRVDLGGGRVYPALVTAQTALGLVEIRSIPQTVDTADAGPLNPHLRAEVAVNPDSELIPVARARGVLYALAVPEGEALCGRSALMRLAGRTWEEMTAAAPVALHVRWPDLWIDRIPAAPGEETKEEVKEQEEKRRAALRFIREAFDAARAYARARAAEGRPEAGRLVPDLRWEAMLPAVRREIPVAIHADTVAQIRSAVLWAEEAGVRPVIFGGRDAWRLADWLAARRIPVVFDAVDDLPRRRDLGSDALFRAPAALHAAGVPFCIAKSGWASDAGNLPQAAALAAAHGLPPAEALKAITLAPARILGVDRDLGSLEPGKRASFIVVDGDILDVRAPVRRAFLDGAEVDLTSRHTRLYERYGGGR